MRAQLGREPTTTFDVVARCWSGHPLVIRNQPRDAHGDPFPTTFWLTCPAAVKAVSRIESDGAIARLNERFEDDPAFRADVERAHAEAAEERERLLPGSGDWGGVGGTRRGLKCLHAHYANHLAGGDDVVGAWVAERVEPIHPEEPAGDRIAVIDQGTHTCRLLVVTGASRVRPRARGRHDRHEARPGRRRDGSSGSRGAGAHRERCWRGTAVGHVRSGSNGSGSRRRAPCGTP